jgi:hypothetical protein
MTDEEGIVTFEKVPTGNHTIEFNYKGVDFEESLELNDSNTQGSPIKVKIDANDDSWVMWAAIIGILSIVIVFISWFVWKKIKKESEPESVFQA